MYLETILCVLLRGDITKCSRCGKEVSSLNHYYIPRKGGLEGLRYCISCAKEEHVVTLV